MIPMEMGEKKVDCARFLRSYYFLAKVADTRSGIKNNTAVLFGFDFNTGGISANR